MRFARQCGLAGAHHRLALDGRRFCVPGQQRSQSQRPLPRPGRIDAAVKPAAALDRTVRNFRGALAVVFEISRRQRRNGIADDVVAGNPGSGQTPANGYVALSQGTQTAHTGFAVIARFNPDGNIDARNGAAYGAAGTIPYSTNVKYHFRLVVNVASHTYSVFVTPAGGSETTVATNFSFRSEQSGVTSLNNWATWAQVGSVTACGFGTH